MKLHQVMKSDFCIEAKVEGVGLKGRCWLIFTYTNIDINSRNEQWEILNEKRKK